MIHNLPVRAARKKAPKVAPGARSSARKFPQNLLSDAKSAHVFPHVRLSGTQDRVRSHRHRQNERRKVPSQALQNAKFQDPACLGAYPTHEHSVQAIHDSIIEIFARFATQVRGRRGKILPKSAALAQDLHIKICMK